MVAVKHTQVTAADNPAHPVSANAWNSAHTITGTPGKGIAFDGGGVAAEVDLLKIDDATADTAPTANVFTRSAQKIAALISAAVSTCARVAVDRAALSSTALTAIPVYLWERGRQGWWDHYTSTEFSTAFGVTAAAAIAADTAQGVIVSDGAGGVWMRSQFLHQGVQPLTWHGGKGDCTAFGVGTDNSPAINSAKAIAKLFGNGAAILIPKAKALYRCASTINFTEHVHLVGQGYSENPGTVAGTTYSPPKNYRGSVLAFDADVPGLQFTAYTDQPANAPLTQYESSIYSVARDLMVLGGGGVGTTAHGIDHHVCLRTNGVRITGFAGNGLNVIGNTSGSGQYGNNDSSNHHALICDSNRLHGIKLDGNDSNVISFTGSCSSRNNGGCGTLDLTIVGNNGFDCFHYATNNRSHPTNSASGYSAAQIALVQAEAPCLTDNMTGSAVMYRGKDYSGNDIGNISVYKVCYVETGSGSLVRLRGTTKVIGGSMSQVAIRHSEYNCDTWGAGELRGVKDFYQSSNGFNFWDASVTIGVTSGVSTSVPTFKLSPTAALSSKISLLGTGGSVALGLTIEAASASGYLSADSLVMRNAAQSTTYGTWSSSGLNLASGMVLKANGTQVLTTRQTGTAAAATDLASAIALVNDLRAKLVTHGLIS